MTRPVLDALFDLALALGAGLLTVAVIGGLL